MDSTAKKMCHFRSYTESAALEGIAGKLQALTSRGGKIMRQGLPVNCPSYGLESNYTRFLRRTEIPEEKSADVRSRFVAGIDVLSVVPAATVSEVQHFKQSAKAAG